MTSRSPKGDVTSRREQYEDVEYHERDDKKRYSDQEPSRRRRDRSRSAERKHRRRSRTPDSKSRRSRSRDRYRERDADESRSRRRDKRREGGRDRSRDRDGEKRKPRSDDDKRSRREDKSPVGDYKDRRRDESRDGRLSRRRDAEEAEHRPRSKQRPVRHKGPLLSQDDSFAVANGEEPVKPVEKPNFGNTGTLAAASNAVLQADGTTVALKYHEPPEARKPPARDVWKMFVFKGSDIVDTIELSLRSCWLIGRDMAVVDLPAEHPSISKQHAVIQFRYTEKRNEYGDKIGRVKPYLIDLESANGTTLNKKKVPDSRYLELRDKDMIQFGLSTREYVLVLAPRD
ncbi:SMAD/FHA domain containing protein [Naviculisporaceae sp. PSN 640]